MNQIANFPFFPMEFTKEGSLFKQEQSAALKDYLAQQDAAGTPVSDLLVISHGWNNNMAEARALYDRLLTNVAPELAQAALPPARRFAVMGIFWPSKKFTDKELIAGGGAAGLADSDEPSPAELQAQLDVLRDAIRNVPGSPAPQAALDGLDRARAALPNVDDDDKGRAARQTVLEGLRAAIAPERNAILEHVEPDSAAIFLDGNPDDVWDNLLKIPQPDVVDLEGGGAASLNATDGDGSDSGGAAGFFGDLTNKLRTGAEMMMNLSTYYLMKGRAGEVGRGGAFQVLREVADANPDLRMHLIGHSFGGRLVASIALGPDGAAPLPLASMMLLQAAFSHNGFSPEFPAPNGGFFKRVVSEGRIQGPIVITFTKNDMAVGYAYPLASRLSSDNAKSLGDINDPFGGIGRNGALHLEHGSVHPTNELLTDATGQYQFNAGAIYNLNGDSFITSHGDVGGPQVAHAVVSAIKA